MYLHNKISYDKSMFLFALAREREQPPPPPASDKPPHGGKEEEPTPRRLPRPLPPFVTPSAHITPSAHFAPSAAVPSRRRPFRSTCRFLLLAPAIRCTILLWGGFRDAHDFYTLKWAENQPEMRSSPSLDIGLATQWSCPEDR